MNVLNRAPFLQIRDATSDADFTARACASTYAIRVGIWAFVFLLVLYSALRHANGAWLLLSMLGCVLVFVLCWVWSFRIRIFGNSGFIQVAANGD